MHNCFWMYTSLKRKRAQFISFKIHKCWAAFALFKIEAFTPQQRRWNLSLSHICLNTEVEYNTGFLIWLELPNGELRRTVQSLKLWKEGLLCVDNCKTWNISERVPQAGRGNKGHDEENRKVKKYALIYFFIQWFTNIPWAPLSYKPLCRNYGCRMVRLLPFRNSQEIEEIGISYQRQAVVDAMIEL